MLDSFIRHLYNMEIRSLQGGLVYYLNTSPLFVMTGCRINKKSANTDAFHSCLSIEWAAGKSTRGGCIRRLFNKES